jgi:4-hydroxyphenylacetate 3-monooxygenase
MPPVREQHGRQAAQAGMVEAMMHGMEAAGEQYGEWWIPNRHQLYSAQVVTQDLYPKMIHVIRELAGGAFIMLPSSFRDWSNPTLAPIIRKTQRSAALDPEGKVKFLKAAWDAVGSEFGSRHTQYEMFYAGAQFVTAGHSFRTYGWGEAGDLVDRLLASFSLEATVSGAKQ